MDRRNIVKATALAGFGLLAAGRAQAEAARASKVVYHLPDAEKVPFALGNLRNHIAGTGGPGAVRFAVVVHGPALRVFRLEGANLAVEQDIRDSIRDGVAFYACANTMAALKLTLADLMPGFAVAEKGGVVLLADLQAQGWAYLRP
jgi:intracellular sulfur oxidation DsrE/DsrF family protein